MQHHLKERLGSGGTDDCWSTLVGGNMSQHKIEHRTEQWCMYDGAQVSKTLTGDWSQLGFEHNVFWRLIRSLRHPIFVDVLCLVSLVLVEMRIVRIQLL